MNDPARRNDRELSAAMAAGSLQAYAELAGRHARGLFDFALRGTLDEQQAGAVLEAVFHRIREPNVDIPIQIDFRTWLYSLCLVEVLAVSNEARTARISTDDDRFFQATGNIEVEFAHWAWQAARGLRTRDYCVLDLTLRRGLTPEEVAEAASLTRSNLYASIGRARGAFEEGYAAMLLYEHGREQCGELDEMIESTAGAGLRPALRHQIIEHADACDRCRRSLDAMPQGAGVYVYLADIEVPDAVVRRILGAAAPPEETPPVQADAAVAGAAASMGAAALIDTPDEDASVEAIGDETFDIEDEPEPADDDDPEEEDGYGPAPAPVAGTRLRRVAAFSPAGADAVSYATPDADDDPEVVKHRSFGDRAASWVVKTRGQPVVLTYAFLGIAAVLAIYLGIAVADSLQSGGRDSGAVPLDTPPGAAAGRQIDCGEPIEVDAGFSKTITFDPAALDGYHIANLSYVPVSSFARYEDMEVILEDPFTLRFAARAQGTPERRTEEYELRLQWARNNGGAAHSVCRVMVHIDD